MANLNNDDFANRIALNGFNLSTNGLNIDFTGEVDELDHANVSGLLNSAWWTWTAPESGEVIINTFGSNYDTTLAVYTGNTLSTLNTVASNDDIFGSRQSAVRFNVVAGTTYQIAVDGFAGATGNIDLNLDLLPNNDNFINRIPLRGLRTRALGTNIGFTSELAEANHADVSGVLNSAWWTWIAPATGRVTIDTLGSNFDTTLAVYTGNRLNDLSEVASNDDIPGSRQSAVTFDVVAGISYQIAVDGFASTTGNIELNLDLVPNNDNFAHRIALNGVELDAKGSNVGFTGEFQEPDHAEASGTLNSAWWTWLAPDNGEVTIDTFGSEFNTSLAVYTGNSLSNLTEVTSNDDAGSPQSAVTFEVVAGTSYQIAVDGVDDTTGNIALNLSFDQEDEPPIPQSNDAFANRTVLTGTEIETEGSNVDFTGEQDEPDHANTSGVLNSAWWSWTAPDSGEVTIDTFGSDFDTSLAVYTGDTLGGLSDVASNNDAGTSAQSSVTFNVIEGTTYQIAVDGVAGATGDINLNLTLDGDTDQAPTPETVDLILDFNGGLVGANQGYDIPPGNIGGFNFSSFTALDRGDGTAGNTTEQILQIVAGVREDFADFNVRVIWDDRGVDSPFFDNQDTVVMVVGDAPTAVGLRNSVLGIAANVDVPEFTGGAPLQSQRDLALTFLPPHVNIGPNTFNEIRELIDTTSHEAGHTFGLSHSIEQDSENRQIVTTAGQNPQLDSRFSPEVILHGAPETGVAYAETDRLNQAVGPAATLPGDTQSSQTLPLDPRTPFVGIINPADEVTAGGTIDFLGDRDAFRFSTGLAGEYTIEQVATAASSLSPVLTLWDAVGDFVALGSGTNGSTITFTANANETYYAIAGSDVDRLTSGVAPVGEIGGYSLVFG
ncbi:hypothetical protein U2F10_33110 [Leptothoe sp. EHU-05/26/07-4]